MTIGYLGLTAALIQQVVFRLGSSAIVSRIPWNVVLLIGGVPTYVGLMQHLGAFERLGEPLQAEGFAHAEPARAVLHRRCHVVRGQFQPVGCSLELPSARGES